MQIINFHLFKEKSARTEQILLTAFNLPVRNNELKVAGRTPSTSTIGVQTMKEHPFCLECNMIFKTETLLSKHISNTHHNVGTDAGCQTEDFDSIIDGGIEEVPESTEAEYKREMKLESASFEIDDNIEVEEMHVDIEDELTADHQIKYEGRESQPKYRCDDCLKIFTKMDTLRNHKCLSEVIIRVVNETSDIRESDELSEDYYEELIHEDDLFECVQCHEKFVCMEDFKVHCDNNIHHYNCEQCDLSFNDIESFQVHNAKSHDDHHCSLCHKRFKTTTTFNQHQKLHESIEFVIDYLDCFFCDECHKIFLLERNLVKHDCPKRKKSDDGYIDESCTDYQYLEHDNDFTCEVCSMEFPNLNMAKQHTVTHSKHFTCPFEGCGCTYEIWSRFAMHLGSKHLNAKKHQCRFCEVECDSFDALQAHYKVECPEKKFKCDHCGIEVSFLSFTN